jgi:hypothetical protein
MLARLKISIWQMIIAVNIAFLVSFDFGCSFTNLTNMWKDPNFKNSPMTNMLIVAAKKDPVNRRIWEDEIVAQLVAHGVTPTPSYHLFENAIPDSGQVSAVVQERKYDGIFFIRRLPTEISTTYVPGYIKKEEITRYNKRTNTYSTFYRDVQEPGYTDTSKIVRHEVSIFTTQEGGRLVWAGTGELINPGSREEVRSEITKVIIPELVRQGIIPTK